MLNKPPRLMGKGHKSQSAPETPAPPHRKTARRVHSPICIDLAAQQRPILPPRHLSREAQRSILKRAAFSANVH